MSKSIKLKENTYWDTNSITHNKQNLKTLLSNLKIKYTSITGLSLGAGATYQLTLPSNTIFVEPLLQSWGSSYSGGAFLTPGWGYHSYFTNTSRVSDSYNGVYIICAESGLVTISSYRHCGALVKGFRIWYLNI